MSHKKRLKTYLGSIGILTVGKTGVEFANEQFVGSAQVVSHSKSQCQIRILQVGIDVVNDVLLVDRDRQNLSLAIDTNDAVAWFMLSGDKNGLSTDAVHVDANTSFDVIEMDIAVFGDQIRNSVLGAHLCKKKKN